MKKKILAICTILLMVSIPFGIGGASELKLSDQNDETISIEISDFYGQDIVSTEIITMSEEELVEFEETVSKLMDSIQSAESWEELENIINNFQKGGIIGSIISSLIPKLFRRRGFVISHGHFLKLNPFKKSQFKIIKGLTFWHYSSGNLLKDRTIILKPLQFKMKILTGRQIGVMSNLLGIYIFVSRSFPTKSYSFFIGTSRRIGGIELHI